MTRKLAIRFLPIAALCMLSTSLVVACGEDPTPLPPLRPEQRPATLVTLPSATPLPTRTAEPTDASDLGATDPITAAVGLGLPADSDTAMIQFARIEPSPWEPAILAEMHPNFTLRADGWVHYRYDGGTSVDGWYQTYLTPTLAVDFLGILWEEIGISELAEALETPVLRYETALDGSPAGSGPVGVIYVRSNQGSARLVIEEDALENPSGAFADRISRLNDVIRAIQLWRNHTEIVPAPDLVKQAARGTMGWWIDERRPYTPDGVLAFGTRARGFLPDGATSATWPLQGPQDPPLSELVTAEFGSTPDEIPIADSDAALLWRSARDRAPSFWGPLWEVSGGERFLIGLRPAVPGGNQVVVDYEYEVPLRGMSPR